MAVLSGEQTRPDGAQDRPQPERRARQQRVGLNRLAAGRGGAAPPARSPGKGEGPGHLDRALRPCSRFERHIHGGG